jgi:hypothetical protein
MIQASGAQKGGVLNPSVCTVSIDKDEKNSILPVYIQGGNFAEF